MPEQRRFTYFDQNVLNKEDEDNQFFQQLLTRPRTKQQLESLKNSLPKNIRDAIGKLDIVNEEGKHYLETYPVGETGKPDFFGKVKFPGGVQNTTIGLRPKGRKQRIKDQENMILGETLHVLEDYSPEFKGLKSDFDKHTLGDKKSLSVIQEMYSNHVKNPETKETRSFDEWYEMTGRDAILRGKLTPDKNNEFSNYPYTDEQEDILSKMQKFMGI